MKILILVTPLDKRTYSGGATCVLRHAAGLAAAGHEVAVVPVLPCDRPQWWDHSVKFLAPTSRPLARRRTPGLKSAIRSTASRALTRLHRLWTEPYRRAAMCAHIAASTALDPFKGLDVVMATANETAMPAALVPARFHCYFVQHFEPLFKDESSDPAYAELSAKVSYHLGLALIANSQWLRARLTAETGDPRVQVCPNGIDLDALLAPPKSLAQRPGTTFTVISYGGRSARWKGFREMAEAIRIARARHPDLRLVWKVFGAALLPPSNPITPYVALGFLKGRALADAYRSADALLSASWYESFPLFPLEAMASGIPVITTQPGTEEFAVHGETAEIVEPRDPRKIADGLSRIITDPVYADKIAAAGNAASRTFSWANASAQMEAALKTVCTRA